MDQRGTETISFEFEEDAITLAQLSMSPKTPKFGPYTPFSSGKPKVLKEKEEKNSASRVKKRNSDAQIKFVVSRRGESSSSFKPSLAMTNGSSTGQAKSSAVIRAQEVVSNLEPEFPSFVKSLVRSHVASCFSMGLPVEFSKSHLPDKDAMITLEDESGKHCGVKYIACKTGLSAGWRQFVVGHKLLEGDVLIFQLVEPSKFKVYIIRANDLTEVDGALGFLNLDSQLKQRDSEKAEMDVVACDGANRKRSKSIPLSVIQNKKKAGLSKSVPKQAEQLETNSEEVDSEVLEDPKLSALSIPFEDIKSFENFYIQIDGMFFDSELHEDARKTYYKLCCSQNAFLHDNVIDGLNKKLVIGIISETVSIADSLKNCKLTTSQDDFTTWNKSLKAFELLGMNVGFLRVRLSQLSDIAYEAEIYSEAQRYAESKKERVQAETEVQNIEKKLAELMEACDKFSITIHSLGSQAKVFDDRFREKVTSPW